MNKTVPTLPPNTTALERAIAVACAELVNVPVPLRDLWNADRCPVNLLPFLAWACSVDRWDDAWPESIKRGTIKASYFIHKHKGTIAAVRRVVESLGYVIRITEWWQTTPPGVPGTFRLDVGVLGSGITDEMFLEMERLTDVRRYADEQDGKVMIYGEQQLAAHRDDADPHPRLAKRSYVDEQDSKVMVYGEGQLAKHAEAKDPHPQYSMKEVATLSKFDASKKLVNAEFVRTNGVRHGASFGFSAAAALTAEHVGGFIYTFGNGGFTLTLPLGADLPAGANITYSNQGGIASAPVTISRQGADTIQSNGGFVNACHVESGSSLVLVHVGNGAWIATGTGVLASSGDFAASLTTNGYQNLPSGEIRQWIQAVIDSSGIVSFPIAFPNALLTVSAVSGNGVSPMYYATGSATLSSVVVTANAPGAAVVTVYATGK